MEIALGLLAAIVAAVAVYYFRLARRTTLWNADPDQQLLARLFIEAGESEDISKEIAITNFLVKRSWPAAETRNRIVHALTIAKIASVPTTFARAKQIGERIHNVSYF